MAHFPNTAREHSETQELCRLILPLSYLYWVTGEEKHRTWLYAVTRSLLEKQHSSGAFIEWDTGYNACGAGAKDGVRKKPCPDAVFEVVRQLGAEALRAVYIGDSEVDVATARNAGLPCISVSWGFRDRDVLVNAGAETICDSMDALYRALREG